MALTKDTIIEPTDIVSVQIRNVPALAWYRLKVEAAVRGAYLGDIASEALTEWLDAHETPAPTGKQGHNTRARTRVAVQVEEKALSPAALLYLARLRNPLKRAYAAALLAGQKPAVPDGLDADAAAKVARKCARLTQ